jgi:hypothetical protein
MSGVKQTNTRETMAMRKERKVAPDRATGLGRREFLRTLGAGATVAAAAGPLTVEARADTETNDEKRKARYQPNSADVQTFYRVNRYPG